LPEKWPHTGAVLAGGAGRRMGRRKDSLPLPDGRTMLAVVHAVLSEVCERVVVIGDAETDLPRIEDLRPGQGPLGGIEALLVSGTDTQYLVCPCDLPLVTATLLRRLTRPTDFVATVFQVEGEADFWPMPVRVSVQSLKAIQTSLDLGRRAVHDLVRALGPEVIAVSRDEAAALANVNTPDDYEQLL
jgi:molybdopterin-guanine dinucleotide biosynthesis protein A